MVLEKKIRLLDSGIQKIDKSAFLIRKREGVAIPIELVIKTIDYFENNGNFEIAAKIAKKVGMNEKSTELYNHIINTYEKMGKFENAARVAEIAGLYEKAETFYNQAINTYENNLTGPKELMNNGNKQKTT